MPNLGVFYCFLLKIFHLQTQDKGVRAISFVLHSNNGANRFTCIYRMKLFGVPSVVFEGKTERVLKTLYGRKVERMQNDDLGVLEQRQQQKINKFLSEEYMKYAKNPYFLKL